jgi:hypothetical protein
MPFERSKEIVCLFKRELIVYQRVLQDERTPTFREVASSFGYRLLVYAVRLKEQDAKIKRVNDKVELSKPAPQTVLNNQ